jgi:OFA family oxalate/formate antiporter-like MFS transporter
MTKRAISVVIAGFFTLFIAFAIRYAYGLILPYMLSSLAISKTEAGIIFSSYFITSTLLAPLFGILADRSDTRIILTVFIAILGVGAGLMSFSSSVIHACVFFGLAGIGHSACWAPVVTVVMRWAGNRRRGIIISIVDLGTTAGIAVWSIIIPIIIGGFSWRTVWISLGITALAVAGMNFFLVRSRPPNESGTQETADLQSVRVPVKEAYNTIFRDIKFHLIGFSYLFISFCIIIPFTFLTSYATQELMIPYSSAAGLIVVIAVAGAIGKLILGHVSDIVGRIRIMMICGLLTAAGSLGMANVRGLSMLFVFSMIFGIGYGTLWSVYAASARDLFPDDYSGSIVGLWSLYHGLGSVIAPVLSGWIIDAAGTYIWAFILGMSGSVLSILLLVPIIKTDSVKKPMLPHGASSNEKAL